MFGEDVRHGGVVDRTYGDSTAAVDLIGEVGGGEVVVEGGEAGVFGKNAGDVVGGGGGGEEEEEWEEEKEYSWLHFEVECSGVKGVYCEW